MTRTESLVSFATSRDYAFLEQAASAARRMGGTVRTSRGRVLCDVRETVEFIYGDTWRADGFAPTDRLSDILHIHWPE